MVSKSRSTENKPPTLTLEWNLLERSNRPRVRSLLSRDMWFFLVIALVCLSIFIDQYRLELLLSALFSTLGLAWIEYRETRVRKRVRHFREEIIYVKSLEAVKEHNKAKIEYQKLLGKYFDIPEFSSFIKDAIKEMDINIARKDEKDRADSLAAEEAQEEQVKMTLEEEQAARDRRRHPRIPMQIHLEAIINFNSSQEKHTGLLKNISTGGALIMTSKNFGAEAGDVINISRLPLSENMHFEEIFGKIAYLKKGAEGTLIGVEFIYLDDSEIEKLDRYLISILTK